MQNKILVAAAAATSATALQLEASPTTNLAQSNYTVCHGTYAYQCIEEKVVNVLKHMTDDVKDHKQDCLDSANQIREEILEGVQELRDDYEEGMADLRDAQQEALGLHLQSASIAITAATEGASQAISSEAEAIVSGESDVSKERKNVMNQIKKLYYEESSSYNPYELKEKIAKKVLHFEEYVEQNEVSFSAVVDSNVLVVEGVIVEE